ncbi:MAG: sortase [Pseudonocardiales bacterium]|nr:sortase [Pseudonocardiales bacterium]
MSGDTLVAAPAEPAPRHRRTTLGDRVRLVLRGIGQTLITFGLIVLLFAVYEVWITNIFAHRAQQKVYNALEQEWRNGQDPLALPGSGVRTIPIGTGIAVMYVPRLGADYHFAIVEGSVVPDDSQLEKGPAHYADTQLPGELGNFGIAGHRVGKGEPFLNLDKLRAGDPVIIQTKQYWFVYRVLGSPAGSDPQDNMADVGIKGDPQVDSVQVPGREIVDPGAGQVLLPIPNHPEYSVDNATVGLLTMTTCHPKFTASQRMIVHAELDTSLTVDLGAKNKDFKMPKSILDLYSEVSA